MRHQVKVYAISEAERQRWWAEAKRRGWTLTMLVRAAVNKEIAARAEEQVEQQKAVG